MKGNFEVIAVLRTLHTLHTLHCNFIVAVEIILYIIIYNILYIIIYNINKIEVGVTMNFDFY